MHNEVQTPVFMPVATRAVARTQVMTDVEALGFPVLLANTLHLHLRPGEEVFEHFGGIQRFMNWPRSVLTDSGGFQVFSLSKSVEISEQGALFRLQQGGRKIMLTPEKCIAIQKSIGSDIMMVLDQCVCSTSEHSICLDAADHTARWAERCLAARGDSLQSMFGIVQGAWHADLRKRSASQITSLPFDGYAIGGLAVGEDAEARKDMTALTASLLPRNYPRYLMGVGTPLDLLEAVHRGVDMFDCILPTSLAQQGVAYTTQGRFELRRGVYKLDQRPLDPQCSCPACSRYSRAYLHHLIRSGEYYGAQLVGLHNLTFYRNLMRSMREKILDRSFYEFYITQRELLARDDEEHPARPTRQKYRAQKIELGAFSIVKGDGFYSVKHNDSGEIMHAAIGPVVEAHELYASRSGLDHALPAEEGTPYVVWDIGMGAAGNTMATILEAERVYAASSLHRPLVIESFEHDLDALRLAAANPGLFAHMRHEAAHKLLHDGRWQSAQWPILWQLYAGDIRQTMNMARTPDIIYHDPFSTTTDAELWGLDFFQKLHALCHNNSILLTYSAATKARAALLAAGFYVAAGPATGSRTETTQAFAGRPDAATALLDSAWLERFSRSSAPCAGHCSDNEREEIIRRVQTHPQFH
jgi:queuine tRNA-ribosyltransferase